jgi:hypothetical protein
MAVILSAAKNPCISLVTHSSTEYLKLFLIRN